MKRFSLLTILVLCLVCFFNFMPSNLVSANDSQISILESAYNTLLYIDGQGGVTSSDNYEYCHTISGQGLSAAEALSEYFESEGVPFSEKNAYAIKREKVLKAYRETTKVKISLLYEPQKYAQTENGAFKLKNDYDNAILLIDDLSATKNSIDTAYADFKALVDGDGYVKNISTLKTNENQRISATLVRVDNEAVFSPDDVLVVKEYGSSSAKKNLNKEILKLNLVENDGVNVQGGNEKSYFGHGFGVAYYFEIRHMQNGKYVAIDSESVINVDVASSDLAFQNGQSIYVAQYLGNGEITLSDKIVIENGKFSFNVLCDGEYALIASGFGIASESQFLWFLQEFWAYLLLILIILILVALPIIYSKRLKRRLRRKYNRKFKKFLKEEKRNKKRAKIEKRKAKKLKRKERLKKRKENLEEKEVLNENALTASEEIPQPKAEEKNQPSSESAKENLTSDSNMQVKVEKNKQTEKEEASKKEEFISHPKEQDKSSKPKNEDEEIKKLLTSSEDEEIKKILNEKK